MRESVIATRVLRGRALSHRGHRAHLREYATASRTLARISPVARITQP
jgi:hypothetical protein